MKLRDLDARFVRYEARPDGQHKLSVELRDAQGIMFLCPACFKANGGPVGTHYIEATFAGRGAAEDQGSKGSGGTPTRWTVAGSGLEDLSLTPSIKVVGGCGWHGFVTHGEAA